MLIGIDASNLTEKDLAKYGKYARDIKRILEPHDFCNQDSIYAENNIAELLQFDSAYLKKWPTAKFCAISNKSEEEQLIDFYSSLFKQMTKEYITHAISMGDMSTYDSVVKNGNVIDMTKTFIPTNRTSMLHIPDAKLETDQIELLRTLGWKVFTPCFENTTYKVNRKRYIHVMVENIDLRTKTMTLKISDYNGDKYDWIRNAVTKIHIAFKQSKDKRVSFVFDIESGESYEKFLSKFVEELHWTKQQIQFWFDVFGIDYFENMILCMISIPEIKQTKNCIIKNETDFKTLKSLLPHDISLTSIVDKNKILDINKKNTASVLLQKYLKYAAVTNYQIYISENKISPVKNTPKITYKLQSINIECVDSIKCHIV